MNRELLKYCLQRIEQKLAWTSNDLWLNQDFELLSERIFEETGVKLSITTLKRVWGKVNYTSEPSISTLNALAKFIGYGNWSELKNGSKISKKPPKKHQRITLKPVLMIGSVVLVIGLMVGLSKRSKGIDLDQIEFGVRPVTLGLPNSVVFTYDFGNNIVEQVTIQLSWNQQLTFSIDPNKEAATGIYYYPGYFRAKLLVDNQVLKEQDLHIKTDGWMATLNKEDIPRYLYDHELQKTGSIGLTERLLAEVHSTDNSRAGLLTFHYFDDFNAIKSDEFIFETRFRNTYKKSNGICQNVQLLVHGKDGVFLTPFSIPGCSSEIELITSGETHSGKDNDLSSFGINTREWNDFRLVVSQRNADYYINDTLIFSNGFNNDIGEIVGFKFRFEGAGELDYAKLSNSAQTVFNEDFTSIQK
ncbi:MAG: hypothetical protein ACJAVN_002365 [Roseivirga sp.]|jgi:hypothetical protein